MFPAAATAAYQYQLPHVTCYMIVNSITKLGLGVNAFVAAASAYRSRFRSSANALSLYTRPMTRSSPGRNVAYSLISVCRGRKKQGMENARKEKRIVYKAEY